MNRRVRLKKGKQREIILLAVEKYGSLKHLSKKFNIPYSTFKKYAQETRLLPEGLFENILSISNIKKENLDIAYLDSHWGTSIGGKIGIKSLYKMYPQKIKLWRNKGIKKFSYSNKKSISIPKLNDKLAEFIGVYLGDGTITNYFIRISGDSRYDQEYFDYLSKLVYELFNIHPTIYSEKNKNTFYLLICSKDICSFLNKEFKIKFGDKIRNKMIIPIQIINRKELSIACLRGIIDTDGSVSRRGNQFCVQFSNNNSYLLNQVYTLANNLGIFTYLTENETGTNRWENVLKYFNMVGSSNMKHIIRFMAKYREGKALFVHETEKYHKKYRGLELPFKIKL